MRAHKVGCGMAMLLKPVSLSKVYKAHPISLAFHPRLAFLGCWHPSRVADILLKGLGTLFEGGWHSLEDGWHSLEGGRYPSEVLGTLPP
jgi:hypothetical protein